MPPLPPWPGLPPLMPAMAVPPCPTRATVAEQPPATAAIASDRAGPALAAGTATPDQTGRAAVAADLTGPAVTAAAAVSVQQPAGAAVLARHAVGAVADQRAAQQRLGGRVDRAKHELVDARGLGSRIRQGTGRERLHELSMKCGPLRTDGLIGLRVPAEYGRDRRGHLVGRRRQHLSGRNEGRSVGRPESGADAREIRCGGDQ